ncbi:MAG: hypothetical protein HY563_03790 [Ignavibacteriales bacterium]|nr:hypothetical protein [Ignavibacteriales bacterium]
MVRRCPLAAVAVIVVCCPLYGQMGDWSFSAAARGLLITTSKIYPNPNNPSFELRTITTPFSSVLGFGGELTARSFGASYYFFLNVEYLSQVKSEMKLDGSVSPPRYLPVEDGYSMIPIEIGGQVYVPLGSSSWRISMGGGVGAYVTTRVYSVAGISADPVGSRTGFGIHVSVNSEYVLIPGVSVIAGLKFRDPEVDVRNRFPVSSILYDGRVVRFQQGEIPSRINVDGMTISAGVRVEIL